MSKSVSITIRMDETLKKDFEAVLDDIGLSLSSAVTVFAKAVSKKHRIPFDLEADSYDEKEILHLFLAQSFNPSPLTAFASKKD